MAKAIESTPRRASTIAAAIVPAPAPVQTFEKITMTVPAEIRESVALACVKLKVSESAFYTAGARLLLNASIGHQREALRGVGKRRKA